MYELTEKGQKLFLGVVTDFCHGFNISEIAANTPELKDENDIKVMMMLVLSQAGIIEFPEELS